jgi:hypothetical protein
MEQTRGLRENAARYSRLSRSINSPDVVALLEAMAAQATEEAERMEAKEAASVAERGPVYRLAARGAPAAGSAVSERSGVLTNRDAELEPDRLSGRRADVSPMLISLLHEDSLGGLSGQPSDGETNQLGSPRGIVIWLFISAVMWALLVWWVL